MRESKLYLGKKFIGSNLYYYKVSDEESEIVLIFPQKSYCQNGVPISKKVYWKMFLSTLYCFFYSTYLRLHYGVSEVWQIEKVPHAKHVECSV